MNINKLLIRFFNIFLIKLSTYDEVVKQANKFKNLYNQLSESIEQVQTLNTNNELIYFVLENRKHSHSQFWQDLIAYKLLIDNFNKKDLENNFIEVGAWDGVEFSNTYYLEKKHNFKGVCVEPLPYIFKKLKKNRASINLNFFVSNTSEKNVFIYDDGMKSKRVFDSSNYHQTEKTNVISLNQIFEDYFSNNKDVDFVSIDTEGSEIDVLQSLDLTRFRVKLFCIENNSEEIDIFFKDLSYEKLTQNTNAHDNWYILRN